MSRNSNDTSNADNDIDLDGDIFNTNNIDDDNDDVFNTNNTDDDDDGFTLGDGSDDFPTLDGDGDDGGGDHTPEPSSSENGTAKKKRKALLIMGGMVLGIGGLIGGGFVLKNNLAGNQTMPVSQHQSTHLGANVQSLPEHDAEPTFTQPPVTQAVQSTFQPEADLDLTHALPRSGTGSMDDALMLEIINQQLNLALDQRFKQQDLLAEAVVKNKTLIDQHEKRVHGLEAELAILNAWREEELIKERARFAASEMARIQANGGISIEVDADMDDDSVSVTVAEKPAEDKEAKRKEEERKKAEAARKAEEARKAEAAKKAAAAEAARKAEVARKAKAEADRKQAVIGKFVVVATYPSTAQPGMAAERAWITDGKELLEVREGSDLKGIKITGIKGTTVVTAAGTIPAAK